LSDVTNGMAFPIHAYGLIGGTFVQKHQYDVEKYNSLQIELYTKYHQFDPNYGSLRPPMHVCSIVDDATFNHNDL
jgi:hypothetical protein